MIYEQRTLGSDRVDTIRITLDTPPELIAQYARDGYTEVMEHYLVLYKPPEKIVLKEKLDSITDALPDDLAAQHADIYPTLQGGGALITSGKRIRVGDALYRASVDLWDNAESTPEAAPNLWTEIKLVPGTEYRVISDPILATETFSFGEIGMWTDGKLYKSVHPHPHAWTPADYPAAWELYMEGE